MLLALPLLALSRPHSPRRTGSSSSTAKTLRSGPLPLFAPLSCPVCRFRPPYVPFIRAANTLVRYLGWEDKVFKSIDDFFPASSRHVILPGTSVSELGEGFVSVEGSNHASKGFSDTINFDVSPELLHLAPDSS